MKLNTHTPIPDAVKTQKWKLFGADAVRSGEEMARRFSGSHFQHFAKALEYFAVCPVGAVFKTGFSAYERIE